LAPLVNKDPDGKVNIFFGGAWDDATGERSPIRYGQQNLLRNTGDVFTSKHGYADQLFKHDEMGKALESVKAIIKKHPDEPVNVIGHSWGGKTAIQLTNALKEAGISVNFLVTIDPVSMQRPTLDREGSKPTWLNVYVPAEDRGRSMFGEGDFWARIGGAWYGDTKADVNLAVPGTGHVSILGRSIQPALDQLRPRTAPEED